MLKIALICGGTGSIALQKGFAQLFGYENYRLDTIINAYDNGKSTGVCRRVFDGKILGPSDLRKNQLTQYALAYEKELADPNSYESKLLALFDLRFSAADHSSYYEQAYDLLIGSDFLEEEIHDQFIVWLNYFFFQDRNNAEYRTTVVSENFNDFSLSNVFYASCAAMNDYSLEYAGKVMSRILKIDNRVHLISNTNLYLSARTESGLTIKDEGNIVIWNNPEDRIVEAILTDRNGQIHLPEIDENEEEPVTDIFKEADIVIFSSGTQWSSLIPTYMHAGFRELINELTAKKYLIMNNEEDGDMLGVCADGILDTVSKYIELDDVTIILNDNAMESMRNIREDYCTIHGKLSEPYSKKHISTALVAMIMGDYFRLNKGNVKLISDLDGTLWDEVIAVGNKEISIQNMAMFRGTILSGNNYEHVYSIVKEYFLHHDGGKIYCDYGNTYFDLNSPKYTTKTLSEEYAIEDGLLEELELDPDFAGKVTLRGNAIVTIKPLNDRQEKLKKLRHILQKYGTQYKAELAGHTSIDITKAGFSKAASLYHILEIDGIDTDNVLYLGNELDEGNEVCIRKAGIQTRQINDVFEMNLFLKTMYSFEYASRGDL